MIHLIVRTAYPGRRFRDEKPADRPVPCDYCFGRGCQPVYDHFQATVPASFDRRANCDSRFDLGNNDIAAGATYATVHVAAAAAAIWRIFHAQKLAEYRDWRLCEAFWHALDTSQQLLPNPSRRYFTGVLDAEALLAAKLRPAGDLKPTWRMACKGACLIRAMLTFLGPLRHP